MTSITVGEAIADGADYRFRGEIERDGAVVAFTIVGRRDVLEGWDRARDPAQPAEGATKRLAWLVGGEAMRRYEIREWKPTEGDLLRLP